MARPAAEDGDPLDERTGVARFHFFVGPGGVGKTTCAAAAALASAAAGHPVLVVSVDFAHSLGDVLGLDLASEPRRVAAGSAHLWACELAPEVALERWSRPRRPALVEALCRATLLDEAEAGRLLDRTLPGLAEWLVPVELLQLAQAGGYAEVFVDTAPIAHTLRLLRAPAELRAGARSLAAWTGREDDVRRAFGASPVRSRVAIELAALAERIETTLLVAPHVVWVARPGPDAVARAERGMAELTRAGLSVSELWIGPLEPRRADDCSACAERTASQERDRAALEEAFPALPQRGVPELVPPPRGVAELRGLFDPEADRPASARGARASEPASDARAHGLEDSGAALVFVGGKGGVGKTSAACALALALAESDPSRPVLLASCDPSHALGRTLGIELDSAPQAVPLARGSLRACELAEHEALAALARRYGEAVDELFSRGVEAPWERSMLRGLVDLVPPGLGELLALEQLLLDTGTHHRIVVDLPASAQALHLLSMPATAREWVRALLTVLLRHRELIGLGTLAQELTDFATRLAQLEARWRDPAQTCFVAVARAEDLPRLETLRLVEGLAELGLAVAALVVNGAGGGSCPTCGARRRAQVRASRELVRVAKDRPGRSCAIIQAPRLPRGPIGVPALRAWCARWRHAQSES